MTRTCLDCPAVIGTTGKTGRCRPCAARRKHADPEFRARLEAASRAAKQTPESRARASAAARQKEAARRDDPAWRAYKVASGKRLRADYEASVDGQRRNRENRAEVGRKISETRHAWCPVAYRPAYRALRDKDVPADQARRMIADQIAADRARAAASEAARLAALSPLERQLAAIRAGARVIPKPTFRRPDHPFTLGGVASAAL